MTDSHLPEICFTDATEDGRVVMLKRGRSGYFEIGDIMRMQIENGYTDIATINKSIGVTDEQRRAMECGSMFGWNVPGAQLK